MENSDNVDDNDENDENDLEDFVDNLFEEPVCHKCEEIIEETDDPVSCDGKCSRQYHRKCSFELSEDGKTFCEFCKTSGKLCFSCKKPIQDNETFETCNLTYCCRNSFHGSCLKNRKRGNSSTNNDKDVHFVCRHHCCATCALYGKPCTEGQFLTCIRCPTAYHKADNCVPAGTFLLNWRWVVCTDHHQCSNNKKSKWKINVNFCFICGKGGTLICCESCPCAVHVECVDLKEAPSGFYNCDNCERNKKPMYGDIVWAKFGSHRWWPAQVVHPMKVPDNLEKYLREPGIFIVQFYGTKDYGPVTKRTVYPFEAEDGVGSEKLRRQSLKDTRFLAAIAEAKQDAQDHHFAQLNDAPNYKPIEVYVGKCNVYHSKKEKSIPIKEHDAAVCGCDVNDANPCGDDFCENRSTFFECDSKGDFVIEYCGEIINEEECSRRLLQKNSDPDRAFYFLELANDRIIDAGNMGNDARFINHSCDANCVTQRWVVGGQYRIGLFASRDIEAGEELTFHYNLDTLGLELKTPCKCASPNCLGVIGRIRSKKISIRPNATGRQQKPPHKRRKIVAPVKKSTVNGTCTVPKRSIKVESSSTEEKVTVENGVQAITATLSADGNGPVKVEPLEVEVSTTATVPSSDST